MTATRDCLRSMEEIFNGFLIEFCKDDSCKLIVCKESWETL